MPKINQEEYEVLKSYISEEKYIAKDRDGSIRLLTDYPERDMKREEWSDGWGKSTLKNSANNFKFIQWEDEEPHNIQELIEEYEKYKKASDYFKVNIKNVNQSMLDDLPTESEETEVKKDLEWLKEEIKNNIQLKLDHRYGLMSGEYIGTHMLEAIIDQLDEPEVLSQELIYEKAIDTHVDTINGDIQVTFKLDDLENLLVPKQELPVIAQWVADNIESKKRVGTRLNVAMSEFPEFKLEKELDIDEHECNEIYARAWLDGYEVAEEREQKYYVDLESAAYVAKWDGNGQVDIYTDGISGSDEYEPHLTEQEIKDYDERFWPFAVRVGESGELI